MLAEAKTRLKTSKTRYSGLRQLVGIRTRWADSKAAVEATKILRQYEGMADRPWEKDIAEQRRFLIARARALDSYGSGPLHRRYTAIRPRILKAALQLWKVIEKDGQNAAAVKQAKKRIPVLEGRLKKEDP